jgi:FAD/FMN-containing dehydrogenase
MATIQDFSGLQYPRSEEPLLDQAWRNNNYQYATSTHQVDHDMHPGLIVQPKNEQDIIAAVRYAKDKKVSVAIASGGHQYSGACSTSGE